jgi:para-aminobenzoate synthetase component 1
MNNTQNFSIEYKSINYKPTLALESFSRIEQQPWAMLLRSASPSHPDSRYDIVVANPIATLTTTGNTTMIRRGNNIQRSSDDPFLLLKQIQQQYTPQIDTDSHLPFVGGAVGYFAYDLGRRIEKLPTLAEQDIFLPDMAVGIYTWALVIDHHTRKAYWAGENIHAAESWFNKQQPTQIQPFRLGAAWQSNMSRSSYQEKFTAIQEYLRSGDCYQINLTQRFQAPYSGSEWAAFLCLESANQAPFSAYIRQKEGVILSVSPERFLQFKQDVIETKPIKGTRPRSDQPELDAQFAAALENAEKDQAENLMIVDLLRNDIGRVASPGSVHVPKLFAVESFPAVHHLVSTIRARLADHQTPIDLLRACFPGGSITGAPKIRAMEIIETLEPQRRSVYCGSIGYISRDGQMDSNITIRTLIAAQNQLYVWAGGGIVADSDCSDEYQETFDKLSRILSVFAE